MKFEKKFETKSKYLSYINSSSASLPNVSYITEGGQVKYNNFSSIVISKLIWAKDVAASGGTANKNNCSYTVKAVRLNGSQYDVTSLVEVSGSLTVPSSTIESRHEVGTLNLTFNLGHLSVSGSVTAYQEAAIIIRPSVYFNIANGSVTLPNSSSNFEYSYDNINWSAASQGQQFTDSFYLRGKGNSVIGMFGGMTGRVSLSGNAMALIDYETLPSTVSANAFKETFQDCTGLTSVSSDFLPGTTLGTLCYNAMFYNCTSLVNAPNLPATTLSDTCYNYMFRGCASLVNAPVICATTLASNCCAYMFYECTSLVTAPNLLATTLSDMCYNCMFDGCTALTSAPVMNATTLASGCCAYMFHNCSSLVSAPELPATTLAKQCYTNMFDGCTALTSAPVMNATTLASGCCAYMFHNCSSLVTAPELPATDLSLACYESMFEGCTSLVESPILYGERPYSLSYYRMFYGCSSLNKIVSYAISISEADCIGGWATGVATSGTFTGYQSAGWETHHESPIPSGWTTIWL